MTGSGNSRLALAASGLLGATICLVPLDGQPQETAPLFATHDELELTLEFPLRTLVRQRSRRPEVPGVVSVVGPDGAPLALDVEVTTRGKSRLEICTFPPLSINFKRGQVRDTLFAGQNRLKLVTLCRDSARYEDYLELEYLLYRMYEQVSDFAFRVRPVRMRYVDAEREGESETAPAFFLEHIDSVAARVGMAAVDVPSIDRTELEPSSLAALTLFQYVIGNTDWSATAAAEGDTCCHNHDVLALPGVDGEIVVVPYDFDQAGIINTEYAVPNEQLPIRNVRQRLYRGFCATNDYIEQTAQRYNAARPALEALLKNARLSESAREDALEYLARGYEIIEDSEAREREILGRCRG